MRYFADLTPERARVHAARNYDAWTADPAQPRDIAILGANRERAIAKLAESYLERPGGPDLIDPQAALVSQDRLRALIAAAMTAARAHPDWHDGDELAVIAADTGATVMTTAGFAAADLLTCLDMMTADVRRAIIAAGVPPPGWTPLGTDGGGGQLYTAPPGTPCP